MRESPLVSIVINNYNYGRFLRDAIESAIHQVYRNIEVIVVDDGSTDDSHDVIAGYGAPVIPVLKENGGQLSAINAGFAACHGDVVLFLDADDTLYPTAAAKAVQLLREMGGVKVHWPLREIDGDGVETGRIWPGGLLPEGDLQQLVVREGPESLVWPPTSGNAWAREFLDQIFPLPQFEGELKSSMGRTESTDAYLCILAPLFGAIAASADPLGTYRVHGQNAYAALDFDRKLRRDLLLSDFLFANVEKRFRRMGIDVDSEDWKQTSWFHRLDAALQEIHARVPVGATILLVDEDLWGCGTMNGRRTLPFLEKNGTYWGPPADDASAIQELERQRKAGASYMAFAWPAFWWLEYYEGLTAYLRTHYPCVLENNRLVLFDLRPDEESRQRGVGPPSGSRAITPARSVFNAIPILVK